ncbi:hypothetical protein BKA83DRAFT_146663 [Pisolithus microcarpus]|nr:hypothetical protein BKA83DRAFT_146663 [Pisolithus microcarpus]
MTNMLTVNKIEIVNQLLLPHTTEYLEISTIEEAHEAIKSMKVSRFAALTFAANLSKALASPDRPSFLSSPEDLEKHVTPILHYLYTARPTAVNLGAATRRIARTLQSSKDAGKDAVTIARDLVTVARLVSEEDYARNKKMSENGGLWLAAFHNLQASERLNVLTVCNTGSLATSGYGTALGLITFLHETQRLGRSRLTALELQTLRIPSTMICDTMVGSLFQHRTVHAIGTYNAAVLAARHNIPFIVVAPISTVDLDIKDGSQIPIEHRPPTEACVVRGALYPLRFGSDGRRELAQDLESDEENVYNPSFDVTPAELITAIVTEKGVALRREGEKVFNLSGVV